MFTARLGVADLRQVKVGPEHVVLRHVNAVDFFGFGVDLARVGQVRVIVKVLHVSLELHFFCVVEALPGFIVDTAYRVRGLFKRVECPVSRLRPHC